MDEAEHIKHLAVTTDPQQTKQAQMRNAPTKSVYNLHREKKCVSNLPMQVLMIGTSANPHLLWMSRVCRWRSLPIEYISITSGTVSDPHAVP